MKHFLPLLLILGGSAMSSRADEAPESVTLNLFDKVVFYDGYQNTVIDADLNDGILRHRNSLYAVKLTDEQMDMFGESADIDIIISALCDNYDRIGNINLALVPKGNETYDPFEVSRLELGRFITPFMNKNKQPTEVPYHFSLPTVGYLFHDTALREAYDYWIEFELFGVPYAANQQVAGCSDRNDVFEGTLNFVTEATPLPNSNNQVLVPIVMKKPEYKGHNLNNYSEAGTDTIGTCTKTYRFTVPESVTDSHIVLITSNHGANSGGEEYNRRLHLVYFDDELVMTYTPGGVSCEPYRVYNTQPNGIYAGRRTDNFWAKYSNWCPGAIIPVRYLHFGAMTPGEHKVMIRVPDAEFVGQQGDFPVSMYFQGLKDGQLPAGMEQAPLLDNPTEIVRTGDTLHFLTDRLIDEVRLISYDGRNLYRSTECLNCIDLSPYPAGAYILCLYGNDGILETVKIAK